MFNQEIKKKIRAIRALQGVGTPRTDWLKTNREILLMQVKNTFVRFEARENFFDSKKIWQFLDVFLPSKAVYYIVRPVTAAVLIAAIVMGGWVTTVSASYDSLPGDILYSVKLATETVQITLVTKPQEVKLRVEFASRRADDVNKIAKSNAPKKEKKIEEAVKNLKKELDAVNGALEEIKKPEVAGAGAGAATQAVESAKAVDQKTAEIQKTLNQAKSELSAASLPAAAQVQEQVKQATAAAAETGVKAVEVLVEKHRQNKETVSMQDVKNSVDNQLKILEEKVIKVEKDIQTIATSTPSTTIQEKKETAVLIAPAKESTAEAKVAISQAKEELTKENLGGALSKLKESSDLTQAAEVKTEATKILTAPIAVVSTSTLENKDAAAGQKTSASSSVFNAPFAGLTATSTTSTVNVKEEKR